MTSFFSLNEGTVFLVHVSQYYLIKEYKMICTNTDTHLRSFILQCFKISIASNFLNYSCNTKKIYIWQKIVKWYILKRHIKVLQKTFQIQRMLSSFLVSSIVSLSWNYHSRPLLRLENSIKPHLLILSKVKSNWSNAFLQNQTIIHCSCVDML